MPSSPFTAFRLAREKAEANNLKSFVHKGKTYRHGRAVTGLMVWKRVGGSRPKRQSRRRSR
jgi:hypothetical protein